MFIGFPFQAEVIRQIDEIGSGQSLFQIPADGGIVVDDIAGFNERKRVAIFS